MVPGAESTTVDAVVFDLDGVLVDSEAIWDELRREVAAEAGRTWPDDATRAMQGMSTPEWSKYLHDVVGIPESPEQIARTVIDRITTRYRERLPLIDGAVEAVTRLADHWPLGLASSSPTTLIETVLDASGLAPAFQVTVSTEEVPAGKPAPDVYLTVASRLGVPARSCGRDRGLLQRAAGRRLGWSCGDRRSARRLSACARCARTGGSAAHQYQRAHPGGCPGRRQSLNPAPAPAMILGLSLPQGTKSKITMAKQRAGRPVPPTDGRGRSDRG